MARIRDWPALIYLTSALAVTASIVSIVLNALVYPFADAGRMFAELWRPDASMSISLDHFGRTIAMPGVVARFKSFAARALSHDQFTAGHYDPGWRLA